MAEARIDEDEEELREPTEPSYRWNRRQPTPSADRSDRNKPDHRQASQGPFSSIRAAIKRTASTRVHSHSDHPRERRRPEITILSAEPLVTNTWFPGAAGGFPSPSPPSQPIWGGSIPTVTQSPPSYDQVIKEKTNEQLYPLPAVPCRSTTTTATQTDFPQLAGSLCAEFSVMPNVLESKVSSVRRPPKPPRPSFPSKLKTVRRKAEAVTENPVVPPEEYTETHTVPSINKLSDSSCKSLPDPFTLVSEQCNVQTGPSDPCLIFLDTHSAESVAISPEPSGESSPGEHTNRPIPVPRSRLKRPITNEVKVQTLVRLKDDGESAQVIRNSGEVSTGKYLLELLDIFHSEDQDFSDQSGEDSMSTLQAKIQAFEKEVGADNGDGEINKPEPRPRLQQPKPPVVLGKPSLPPKPSNNNLWEEGSVSSSVSNANNNVHSRPSPAPRPFLPSMSTSQIGCEDVPAMHRPKLPLHRPPRPPVAPRAKSFMVRNEASVVSGPDPHRNQAVPMLDLLNLNNHTTTQPSKGGPEEKTPDPPPPLPAEKPVSGRPLPVARKPSLPSKFTKNTPLTESIISDSLGRSKPGKMLPPGPMGGKVPPPRPPPVKVGPGRPPPPQAAAASCRSSSDAGPERPKGQGAPKKGPALPPRPNPGHRLCIKKNKNDVLVDLEETDSTNPESQLGDTKCQVQQSVMNVTTTLSSLSSSSALQAPGSGRDQSEEGGLQVQVLHNFIPEGPDELSLRVGDVVSKVERVDCDWYRGTCKGCSGIFPVNHVKVLTSLLAPSNGQGASPGAAAVSGPRCVARFDFEGEQKDELSFSGGDVIKLKEYVDQEWVRGEKDGRIGIFPINFVEIVQNLPVVPVQQADQTKIKLPAGVTSSHWLTETTKPNQVGAAGMEWAVALYGFNAQTDEDLSFQQGEHILVVEHVNSEWCYGRLNGNEGLFPTAFVQTLGARHSETASHSGCDGEAEVMTDP